MATGIDFSTRRGGVSRRIGGLAALSYPLALTALALSVACREAVWTTIGYLAATGLVLLPELRRMATQLRERLLSNRTGA